MAKRTVFRKGMRRFTKGKKRIAGIKKHLAVSVEDMLTADCLLDSKVWPAVQKGLEILVREAKEGNAQALHVAQRILLGKRIMPFAGKAKMWLTEVNLSVTKRVLVDSDPTTASRIAETPLSAEALKLASAPRCEQCLQPTLGRVAPLQRFCSDDCRSAHRSAHYGKAGACQF